MSAVAVPIVPAIRLGSILYATDFSEASGRALPIVAALARKYGSHVYMAHVWSPLPYSMVAPEALLVLENKQESEARKELEGFAGAKELEGIPVSLVVAGGDAVAELNQAVRQCKADLVILSTHGRTGFKHVLMGSVAEELFRSLPCPVLSVGPGLEERFRTPSELREILFPTDLSVESQTVFPYLASLASEFRAHLTLLHVLPLETAANPEAKILAEPLRKEMQRVFSPQICPKCSADFVIDFGDATEQILDHARRSRADLIGLGIRRAAEITTHFRSTVAYKVVVGACCPVLTARADKW